MSPAWKEAPGSRLGRYAGERCSASSSHDGVTIGDVRTPHRPGGELADIAARLETTGSICEEMALALAEGQPGSPAYYRRQAQGFRMAADMLEHLALRLERIRSHLSVVSGRPVAVGLGSPDQGEVSAGAEDVPAEPCP